MKFSRNFLLCTIFFITAVSVKSFAQSVPIRYFALGDSYTIGSGVKPQQAWPALLGQHLIAQGFDIKLMNLGQGGWTSQDVLTGQVPRLVSLDPNFVTLLIGANDVFQGLDRETFKNNFKDLLDKIQKVIPANTQVLIVTIPDFSFAPLGSSFGNSANLKLEISVFNDIIVREAQSRGLKVADIFKISQRMGDDPSLVVDGLHPSPKGHLLWEEAIFPDALELVKRVR